MTLIRLGGESSDPMFPSEGGLWLSKTEHEEIIAKVTADLEEKHAQETAKLRGPDSAYSAGYCDGLSYAQQAIKDAFMRGSE